MYIFKVCLNINVCVLWLLFLFARWFYNLLSATGLLLIDFNGIAFFHFQRCWCIVFVDCLPIKTETDHLHGQTLCGLKRKKWKTKWTPKTLDSRRCKSITNEQKKIMRTTHSSSSFLIKTEYETTQISVEIQLTFWYLQHDRSMRSSACVAAYASWFWTGRQRCLGPTPSNWCARIRQILSPYKRNERKKADINF